MKEKKLYAPYAERNRKERLLSNLTDRRTAATALTNGQ